MDDRAVIADSTLMLMVVVSVSARCRAMIVVRPTRHELLVDLDMVSGSSAHALASKNLA